MMRHKNKTLKTENHRINVNEAYELQYWAYRFNVSQEQLRKTVQAIGAYKQDIEHYFKKKHPTS